MTGQGRAGQGGALALTCGALCGESCVYPLLPFVFSCVRLCVRGRVRVRVCCVGPAGCFVLVAARGRRPACTYVVSLRRVDGHSARSSQSLVFVCFLPRGASWKSRREGRRHVQHTLAQAELGEHAARSSPTPTPLSAGSSRALSVALISYPFPKTKARTIIRTYVVRATRDVRTHLPVCPS